MKRFAAALAAVLALVEPGVFGMEPRVVGMEPGVFRPRAAPQAQDLLYVCVQDDAKVAVVDMASKTVLRTIDFQKLGYPATAKPHYVQVEPDGSFWYLSLIGANRVLKIDRQDKIVGQFEMETPGMLALAGSEQLVVTRSMSAVNPPKRIAILNRKTMTGEEVEILFARPHPMAATSTGYAYTGSLGVNQVASISLADHKVTVTSLGGPIHSLVQFTTTRDGLTLIATGDSTGQVLGFSLVDPAKPKMTNILEIGKMAFDPVLSPDERQIWVPVKSSNDVVVIDRNGASWSIAGRIKDESLKQPQQIVFSADGAFAFVTNNNKMDHMADPAHAGHDMPAGDGTASLVVVDVKTRKVVKAIPLGKNLTGMGSRARR